MNNFGLHFIPGPTVVPEANMKPYTVDYGSTDTETEFFAEYRQAQSSLQTLLGAAKATAVIWSGEAMVALWGAMKSIVGRGDKVLAVGTGLYGDGMGEMAQQIGAEVQYVKFEWNQAALDLERIKKSAEDFRPKVLTLVHCETPSGVLNIKIPEIGKIAKSVGALFYVDFVSSGAGTPVKVDEWGIDLGLLGSQKALCLPPDLAVVTVSPLAWAAIEKTAYVGYDALLPWKGAELKEEFPYTHNWRAIAALNVALNTLLKEGLDKVYERHLKAKEYTLARVAAMGLQLFAETPEISSPTVTAIRVPTHLMTWKQLNAKLREKGVCVGGSYGKLAGVVFRIGHMGWKQTELEYLKKGLDILESVVKPQ